MRQWGFLLGEHTTRRDTAAPLPDDMVRRQPVRRVRIPAVGALLESAPVLKFHDSVGA